jgi:crotonobetainyl-CoA:carnitine CoA-transferase CaiB-like acyl-CoA transferase
MHARPLLAGLWTDARLPADALDDVFLTGRDPVLPSSFAVGTAAQVSIAATALAAAAIWRQRGGRRQLVSVDMRHAATEFLSEHRVSIVGTMPEDPWDRIAGAYPCGDGRWVRLHTNFPHHRDGMLKLLGCAYDRQAVADALRHWTAFALEDAAAQAGLVAAAMRDFATWDAHPHGQAVPTVPVVRITRIGDAPPRGLPAAPRPLSGVRVLDLTRVIAGPVCGRTLAVHGADVLAIASPRIPNLPRLVTDTGRGKLTADLDLRDPGGRELLETLLRDADIFVQGYRPGAIADLGFSPQDTARLRPGIVHVSLSAYGPVGPWSDRRGFDSLVQTATGFNHAEAEAAGQTAPKPLPAQALDHASGYLLAFGALTALHRRMTEGGSWHVQVSLARTGRWIRDLGRVPDGFAAPMPTADDTADLMEESESGFGRLRAVRHAASMAETPPRWDRPSMPLGAHPPAWPGDEPLS